MGLDQYIYRVKKPQLEDRTYTAEEISNMGLASANVDEVKYEASLIAQILPYTVVRNVTDGYINKEKIIKDFNLPKDSYIGMWSARGIDIGAVDDNGVYKNAFVSKQDIEEKYTIIKTVPTYIWKMEEEAYWRKHYELQDWFYEAIEDTYDEHVENCGYYVLNAEMIAEMNARFDEHVPEEDPTDDEALVYHEWY